MLMFANNALLGGGVRVRVGIREQREIKRRSKTLLSLMANLDLAGITVYVEMQYRNHIADVWPHPTSYPAHVAWV